MKRLTLAVVACLVVGMHLGAWSTHSPFAHADEAAPAVYSAPQMEEPVQPAPDGPGNGQPEAEAGSSPRSEPSESPEPSGIPSGLSRDALLPVYERLLQGDRPEPPRSYTPPAQPTVYLSFDDGPSPITSGVLDVLLEEGVPATFFVLGSQAERYPDTVRRIVEEGHALGNHSYNHVYQELYSDFIGFWDQITRTEEILDDIAGVRPSLLRAPGGTYTHFDDFYFYYLDQAGYTVFDWNIDSGDSRSLEVSAEEIAAQVNKGPFPHEVHVLMHDAGRNGETLRALPEVIRIFKEKGYQFAVLSEEVKPVQFQVRHVKWKRDRSLDTFLDTAAMIQQVAQDSRDTGPLPTESSREAYPDAPAPPGQTEAPDRAGPPASGQSDTVSGAVYGGLAGEVPPSLNLFFGQERIELLPYQYRMVNERFHVPLRVLIQQIGGSVHWDEERRVAAVRYGMKAVEYEIDSGRMTIYAPGAPPKIIPFADMKVSDGSIIVPLRKTAQLLGVGIAGYQVLEEYREVSLHVPGRGPLLAGGDWNLFAKKWAVWV